jgi:hypothetical protein
VSPDQLVGTADRLTRDCTQQGHVSSAGGGAVLPVRDLTPSAGVRFAI